VSGYFRVDIDIDIGLAHRVELGSLRGPRFQPSGGVRCREVCLTGLRSEELSGLSVEISKLTEVVD